MQFLENSLVELITQTSTNLPPDVRAAMARGGSDEKPDTQASQALNIILSNIDMAAEDEGPICQDTGMPTFYVHTPVGVNQIAIKQGDPRSGRGSDAGAASCVPIRSIRSPAKTAATIWARRRR